eukprot:c18321_g1_i2.p2 GENE.c18321_g1_i2~~c18321_g1_i2.p2  ORF type:complete len:101 (+),score=19.04 c18321_g1_i2:2-304(+)
MFKAARKLFRPRSPTSESNTGEKHEEQHENQHPTSHAALSPSKVTQSKKLNIKLECSDIETWAGWAMSTLLRNDHEVIQLMLRSILIDVAGFVSRAYIRT